MRFAQFLEETRENHAVLAFGRMNPITSGHEKLVNKVKEVAKDFGGSHHIVLSHSQDAKKNPLSAEQKVKHAKRAFPGTNFTHSSKESPNILTQAAELHKKGVTHLHVVGGSDRVEEYHKLLHKYNGKHEGALFNFKHIRVHSAGERDPDAEGVTGMSASKMREHAKGNNFEHFKKGVPSSMSHSHAKELFNDVRRGMNLKEDVNILEDLRQWFNPSHPKGGWKRINSKGEAVGPCAREPGEPKPKCMSNEKRAQLSKSERASAVRAKRRHDPVADRPGKGGKPVNVSNFGKGKISEDIDTLFEELLIEGVHDQAIFKAVFLAGGPGSGKDYILSNTLDGHGLVEINSDNALEFLLDKEGLSKKMPASEKEQREIVRQRAKNMTELRQKLALIGRNGLIINGTGDDAEKIQKIKQKLEQLGYDTHMILVNTDDEVSKQRNIERGQRGGRTVPEEIRKDKWDAVQASRPKFAEMFGKNYVEFDNSQDLRTAPPEVVKAKKDEMAELFKGVQQFIANPPQSEKASKWVASEMQKKDTLPVPKGGAEMVPHPTTSGVSDEASKLGLQYYGFGRYGKNGKVTHRSIHGKLVDVEKFTNINEEVQQLFEEEMLSEDYQLSDSGALNILLLGTSIDEHDFEDQIEEKYDLLKDKTGRVRTFMLRRAAAREAHQNGGEVLPYKNGYVIKIKGAKNVKSDKKFYREFKDQAESRNAASATPIGWSDESGVGETSRLLSEGVAELTSGQEYARGEGISAAGNPDKETPLQVSRKKITIQDLRKKQKVEESIDKGIEPGISMAAAGESPARDMGEKIKKRTGKATQVAETVGSGGEMATSMSDFNDNVLKQKGINIRTFKAKRPIG